MKTKSTLVLTIVVLFVIQSSTFAVYIDVNDGLHHVITNSLSGRVRLDFGVNNYPGTSIELCQGGTIRDSLNLFNWSQAEIAGGRVGWQLVTSDQSQVIINSGTIGEGVWAQDSSKIDIYGGQVNTNINHGFHAHNNGIITLYGVFDVPYGSLPEGTPSYGSSPHPSGHITGVLANGDIINHYYYIFNNSSIILAPIPEPATLLLLSFGAVMLRKKSR